MLTYRLNGNGTFDYLYPARKIFEHYYTICGLPVPDFLSKGICDDERENGRDKWRKLFINSPKIFKKDKLNHNILTIDVSLLDKNSNKFGMKPSTVYKNDLDQTVLVDGKDGKIIELNKKAFYKWIGISAKKLWFKSLI